MMDRVHSLWDRVFSRPASENFKPEFPRLSLDHASIKPIYDVVVVGSGYGGSIAASRCARAGQTVCVLERGKEWHPGEFPESFLAAFNEIQIHPGGKNTKGEPSSLYEFYVTEDLSVVQGCGLGGGSLINANVGLDADPRVYEDQSWPSELKQDLESLMTIDRKHVVDMLKPTPYPDHYPKLDKIKRMEDGFGACDIEDIDKTYYKTPLYVTFEDKPSNHVGVPQPKCTGCGNCCGGCNVGAKNTLNMNYLPDAKAHGAEIFTEVEVISVTKVPGTAEWMVKYKRLVRGSFTVEEETIRATHVIIGAGALGSTKLLLRSRERGLNVSNQIGKNFSTNGDVLGFSFNGAKKANSVGLTTQHMARNKKPPGPCITSVMDFRKTNGNHKKGFVVEDGTPPSVISGMYSVGLSVVAKLIGIEKYSSAELLERAWQELKGKGINKSLAFLCMSHDDASGIITYDNTNDSVDITWKRVGYEENFVTCNQAMEKVTAGLSGTFVQNPMWTPALGKSVISAHPLGGCPMGESGQTAVVNHAGQVFDGDSGNVLEGLYVVDGAILPIAVGVNPTLTISCLAERCLRLLAKREGWHIDYDTFKPLDQTSFVKPKPGIRFTEKMVGTYESSSNKGKQMPCEFTLTIESDDVEQMLNCDPSHSAKISGTVTCLALSSSPLTVSDGHFQLFSTSKENVDTKNMVYKMTLNGDGGRRFSFEGVKYVHKDHFGETGLKDTTTLFVKIFRLGKEEPLGNATLYITAANFAKQLETMEIINTQSTREKLYWIARFGAFFAKTLWDVYGPVSSFDKYFNPDAPPRKKRPLELRGCLPEVFNCTTEDKFEIALTRYNGGSKGPVVMFHGAGVSSGMFSLDTIDTNLVEYLVQHRYDVWLVDWRTSCNLPSMVRKDYSLDDCAAFDYPAAINKVIEITKQKDVQVVAHCAGSLVCFASLLSGALEGKVRSLVASQVAANPIPCSFNKLKAGLHIPGVMEAVGVKGLTVDTDDHTSWAGWLFDKFVKGVDYLFLPYEELCRNPVCHRITFTYGLLWEHENLTPLTHDTLHEFFGYITAECSAQLALTMREKKLVSASGKDIYLPDVDKDDRMDSAAYRKHINRLDMPICFIVGEKNSCYLPESTLTTFNLVKEAHPHQEYSWIQIPGYGHLDCIYGRDAVHDVYPHILKALDAHAQDDLHRDKAARRHVLRALKSLEINPGMIVMNLYSSDMTDYQSDDSDDDDSSSLEQQDQKNIWDEINKLTPLGSKQTWLSKPNVNVPLKKESRYDPSIDSHGEGVTVREMDNPNHPERNVIISMSDLHLDSIWSKNENNRIQTFLKDLVELAKTSLHTLILLGDTLEMWLDRVDVKPKTIEERIKDWKSNETCSLLFQSVLKMTQEDGVKVFYLRGNHDHEMDAETVKTLMGDGVEFIEGSLIYVIKSDDGQTYRIRFGHGHDWDIFNTYSLSHPDDPLGGRPIGYYVTRAVATADKHESETEEIIMNITAELLSSIRCHITESFVMEMLACSFAQKKFTKSLIERALGQPISEDAYIHLDDGTAVKMKHVFDYPYFKRAITKFGSSKTFSLLKGSMGRFNDFLSRCEEDVIVLAHTHTWKEDEIKGTKNGGSMYVNTGTWIDFAHDFSFAHIVPPTKAKPGLVEVRRHHLNPAGGVD
ncbi:unnamed protein product [Porites lobata]|uniref:Cholesterol oxidase n=1 Tax=Porites lobata TaxID=104759 RepID=A0ABN8R6E4_9CNID|nr:unnamed protein product [Porites lobata]